MELFNIQNLSFAYPTTGANALRNVNLTVRSGEFIVVCGKSGSGKTTLLRILLGLETADSGSIRGLPENTSVLFQ